MSTLLAILGVLFLTLIIGVPLLERHSKKSGSKDKEQDYSSITRLIYPLMAVLIVVQMIRYWFS